MMEASKRATLYDIEAAIGEMEEGKVGCIARSNNDGDSLWEEGLIRTVRMDINRAQEACLGRMSVDPAEGEKVILDLIVENFVLVCRSTGVCSSSLFGNDEVRDTETFLIREVFASEDATGLDSAGSVAMRGGHKLVKHVSIHLDIPQGMIRHRGSRSLVGQEGEGGRIGHDDWRRRRFCGGRRSLAWWGWRCLRGRGWLCIFWRSRRSLRCYGRDRGSSGRRYA